jgi:preprotein translocase subunit SecA
MNAKQWPQQLQKWFGGGPTEKNLAPYRLVLEEINRTGESLAGETDNRLQESAASLRERVQKGRALDDLLVEVFALVREAAGRVLGMRPFDVQVMAGVALHQGKLVEMQTGEGKTLAAVLPACLNALTGRGVHVLTFNDYLARRDAAWMGPVYRFLGFSVGTIQESMEINARRTAYGADITYATAKEAGFDFLRMHLCREPDQLVHRPFNYAIVDEADSILIDEARVPLVIAGDQLTSETSPYRIAEVVGGLEEREDWATDENGRNVFLTERGFDRVEEALECGDLHDAENYLLLTEVNQALHARVLLRRDVDYIVRGECIELVDEFTGRVVADRRWPERAAGGFGGQGRAVDPAGRTNFGLDCLAAFPQALPQVQRHDRNGAASSRGAGGFLRFAGGLDSAQ